MTNPILLITYNNLPLLKDAVASALDQTIPTELYVIDNGSTDGTREWLTDLETFCTNVHPFYHHTNTPPTHLTNRYLPVLLGIAGYCLGIPNDVKIPRNCYEELLKWPRGFVSASDNGHNEPIEMPAVAVSENTPFAVMLIRKWAYEAITIKDGYFFDENFIHYASDCDLALRIASCGIRGVQLNTPFYHFGSATWKLAPDTERDLMLQQADRDRAYFVRKWGFAVTDLEYGQRAVDINFTGDTVAGK